MSTIDIHDIFTKVAAASRNPATPAKASGQKPGSVNVGGHPAPYVAGGGSAEKHKAGDLNPTGTEHQGYVALGGPKPAGKQTAGDLGTHGSPDGGERGSLLGSNLTVTKDAAARPHLSAQGVSDANTTTADVNGASGGGSRAWLKNQGVAGANTMTKDASFEELGMVAGIAAFEDHWKTAEFNEALAVLEANGFDVDKVAMKGKEVAVALMGGSGSVEAMRAEKGKRLKAFGKGYMHDLKGTARGGAKGGVIGAGLGAVGGALLGGKGKRVSGAIGGALGGGLTGTGVGSAVGLAKSQYKTLKKKTAEFNEALAVLEANGFDVDKVADVAGFKMNKAKMIGGMIGDKGKSMYGAASDKAKSMYAPARSRAETLKGAYTGVPVSGMPRVGGAAAGPGGKAGVRAVMDQLSGKEKAVAGAGLAAAAIGTGLAVNKVRKILKKRREAKAEGR